MIFSYQTKKPIYITYVEYAVDWLYLKEMTTWEKEQFKARKHRETHVPSTGFDLLLMELIHVDRPQSLDLVTLNLSVICCGTHLSTIDIGYLDSPSADVRSSACEGSRQPELLPFNAGSHRALPCSREKCINIWAQSEQISLILIQPSVSRSVGKSEFTVS